MKALSFCWQDCTLLTIGALEATACGVYASQMVLFDCSVASLLAGTLHLDYIRTREESPGGTRYQVWRFLARADLGGPDRDRPFPVFHPDSSYAIIAPANPFRPADLYPYMDTPPGGALVAEAVRNVGHADVTIRCSARPRNRSAGATSYRLPGAVPVRTASSTTPSPPTSTTAPAPTGRADPRAAGRHSRNVP